MADVLNPEQRRLNMSRIRSKNSKPELIIRRGLHARGLRFKLHRRDLPGKPDLTFVNLQTTLFVHGCFWHGHGCALSKMPATRVEFWRAKIEANAARDSAAKEKLLSMGWRVLVVWECALRGRKKFPVPAVVDRCERFLIEGQETFHEISSLSPKSID